MIFIGLVNKKSTHWFRILVHLIVIYLHLIHGTNNNMLIVEIKKIAKKKKTNSRNKMFTKACGVNPMKESRILNDSISTTYKFICSNFS